MFQKITLVTSKVTDYRSPSKQKKKGKLDKQNYIKSCTAKTNQKTKPQPKSKQNKNNKIKRQPTKWEKIFANFTSVIYRELLQVNSKKKTKHLTLKYEQRA